jgi:hypothetical protein
MTNTKNKNPFLMSVKIIDRHHKKMLDVIINHFSTIVRSTCYVFLGYINMHKGFKCLDIAKGRIYISLMSSSMKTASHSLPCIHLPVSAINLKSFSTSPGMMKLAQE